jgi:hypothetical protein
MIRAHQKVSFRSQLCQVHLDRFVMAEANAFPSAPIGVSLPKTCGRCCYPASYVESVYGRGREERFKIYLPNQLNGLGSNR